MKVFRALSYFGCGIVALLLGRWISHRFESGESGVQPAQSYSQTEKRTQKESPEKDQLTVLKQTPAVTIPPEALLPIGTAGLAPIKLMHNVGRATARAALETGFYAISNGDVDLAASVLTFDPLDESKIIEMLSSVPSEIREQYRTPERLVAFMWMGGQRMESFTIIAETPPRDDVVVQQIRFKFYDDPTIRDDGAVFMRTPGGWSYVFPTEQIKRMTDALKNSSHG